MPESGDAIRNGRPHIVFVDIRMPFETGLDLIDRFDDREFYVVFYTTTRIMPSTPSAAKPSTIC